MSDVFIHESGSLHRQSTSAKSIRPTNTFVEFRKEEIEQSIASRFEQQVRKYPHRIAVKTGRHEITYEELNKSSNRLARAILAKSGPEAEFVALLLEYGISTVVGMFGALKAGKSHVILDPSFPSSRNAYMLEDSGSNLVVTDEPNLAQAEELARHPAQALNMDEMGAGFSDGNLSLTVSPDMPACIFYTSGSTGEPKGVVYDHRTTLHSVRKFTNTLHICPDDRQSFFTSFSFSAIISYVYGALLNGAGLFPLNLKEEGLDKLADWLISEEITIFCFVPTAFRHFTSALTEETFPRVRILLLGSEAVYKRDFDMYKKHFPDHCLFVNILASTEAGIISWYLADKNMQLMENIVPVGYPADDIEIMLLDESGRDLGIGSAGEIVVKSRYFAPGYWKKPDLTRKAFLPDPESEGKFIYHTGDMGIMLSDGCLVHQGREDFQVKIRGYRIEISEIETALLALDTIKEAAVVAQEDKRGNRRLAAYLVSDGRTIPSTSKLRRLLLRTLPEYMVPSTFAELKALPLTPTGKVDYMNLSASDSVSAHIGPGDEVTLGARPELDTPFVAPRTPVEDKLSEIWGEVIGLTQVGIHDNFFELGGHSLMATQIVSRVIGIFQIEIPLRSLFRSPTVADMAVIIAQNVGENIESEDIEQILAELEKLSEDELKMMMDDGNAE